MKDHLFLALACALVHVPSIFIRFAPFQEIVTPAQRKKFYPLYTLMVLLATTVAMCNSLSDDHAVMRKQLEMAEQLSAQTEHYHSMAERVMEALTMPDTDLCVLLGNALDNALTAAVTSKSDPHITVTATPGAGIQSLLISNTFDSVVQEKDGQFLSRKQENSPGIGLESIRSICDKYDAIMDIRYDSSTFLLLLVLPTREKPQ